MKYEKFEDLPIWKLSVEVAKSIYNITSTSWFKNDYSLVNSVRTTSMLITSNIVEWFETYKDFPKYLSIAKSNLQKLRSQLIICKEIGIVDTKLFDEVSEKLNDLLNQIWGLIYYMKKPKEKDLQTT